MKIPVLLNGSQTILEAHPEESLMNVLRRNGCPSVKSGCRSGFCGACTILFDGKPVSSCKLPVGIAKNHDIITLEYFVKSQEYQIIMSGFDKAGIKLCGHCNAGKIFSAYQILQLSKILTRQEISDDVKNLSPCCTDLDTLVNGIIYALQISSKRIERIT